MAWSVLVNINTSQDVNKAFKSEVALRMNERRDFFKRWRERYISTRAFL